MKKLQIIGNIAKDAETKTTKNGKKFLSFNVGINDNFKNASGEWENRTQWVSCQMYGDNIDPSRFTKGTKIFCEGKLETSIYESKVNWYLTVNNYEIVSKPTGSTTAKQHAVNQSSNEPDFDSDLGF